MIYIIIVNYKSWTDTRDCLLSLLESTHHDWQAIVVDNESNNSSLLKIKESFTDERDKFTDEISTLTEASDIKDCISKIALLQSHKNRGFAGANNLVLEQLLKKEGYVWLLNPDMIVEKETLAELYSCALKQEGDTVLGMTIKSFTNKRDVEIIGGGRVNPFLGTVEMIKDYNDINELEYINGSSFFTSLSTFRKVGFLSEEYFLYWEETDWCFKARKQMVQFKVCKNAIGYDKGATSIGRGFLSDYYYGRNSLIFLHQHFTTLHVFSALFFSVFRIVLRYLTGRPDRAKGLLIGVIDYLKGQNGKK